MLTARLAVLTAVVLLARPAAAQDPPRPRTGDPVLPSPVPGEAGWRVWVAADRLPVRQDPNPGADEVAGVSLGFLDDYYAAAKFPADGGPEAAGTWYFLARADAAGKKVNVPLGWVPGNLLLLGAEARKLAGTSLTEKAVMVNTAESVAAALRPVLTLTADQAAELDRPPVDGRLPVGPQVRRALLAARGVELSDKAEVLQSPRDPAVKLVVDEGADRYYRFEVRPAGDGREVYDSLGMVGVDDGPLPGARRRTGFRLANTFAVYKYHPDDANPKHVLLGVQSSFDPGSGRAVVKGWVPHDRVARWNTAEGMRWDEATRPRDPAGQVLGTRGDAEKWLRRDGGAAVVTEDPAAAYTPSTPRLLVLDGGRKDEGTKNELFRLAASGDLGRPDGRPPADAGKLRDDLALVDDGLRQLDLLFVVDDSQSMQACFRPVGEVIEKVLTAAKGARGRAGPAAAKADPGDKPAAATISRLRVAVTYFSDDEAGPAEKAVRAGRFVEVFDAKTSDAEAEARIARIVGRPGQRDSGVKGHQFRAGGTVPERLYEGVEGAVDEVAADLNASPLSRRVMVVISDAESHPLRGETDRNSRLLVADKLCPARGNPFEFYAIRVEVEGATAADRGPEAVALGAQMRALCGELNRREERRVKVPGVTVARFFPQADATEVDVKALTDALEDRFRRLVAEQEKARSQLVQLRLGEWPANPSRLEPLVLSALATAGLSLDQMRRFEALEVYRTGYGWRNGPAGRRQLQTEFLMSEGDLNLLVTSLEQVFGRGGVVPARDRLELAYKEQLKTLAKEDRPFATFADAFASRFGIKTRPGLLNTPPDQLFEGLKKDPKEVAEVVCRINRLRDRQQGVTRTWAVQEVAGTGGGPPSYVPAGDGGGAPDRVRRYFTQPGSDVKYYWVPFEELP